MTKAVLSLLAKDQEYQALQASDAATAAVRNGIDVEPIFAKNNGRLQIEQIYRFVHLPPKERPVAIVVQTIAADGLPKVARDVVAAGIGWILLNREGAYIDALRSEFPAAVVGVVSIDQVEVGRIQGRQIRARLPEGGSVLYIQGPAESSAGKDRLSGVEEVVRDAPIRLQVLNSDWSEAGGENVVRRWCELGASRTYVPGVVAAQNDAMAIGARKAIAGSHPDWLSCGFLGCDGLPLGGQRFVREGLLTGTVIIPPTAGAAISMIGASRRGATPVQARTVLTARAYPVVP